MTEHIHHQEQSGRIAAIRTAVCGLPSVCLLLLLTSLSGCGDATTTTKKPKPTVNADSSRSTKQPALPKPRPQGLIPQFTEIAQQSGVSFKRYDDQRGQHRTLEANGGGVAVWDYDGDGLLDLFFTNGSRLPETSKDHGHRNALYRNLGDQQFRLVTDESSLVQYGFSYGCAVGDIDNDGFDDLYVTAFGRNALWKNNGDGTFSDLTERTATDGSQWSSSAAFGDFNLDGLLDLYVVNYVNFTNDPPRLCPLPTAPDGYMQCPPTLFDASPDVLFLNMGDGGFRDVTDVAGVTIDGGKGLGVVVFDFDHDGRPDVFVGNDGMPNHLYHNRTPNSQPDLGQVDVRDPEFSERGMELGVAISSEGKGEASMGVACGDIDGDGFSELFLTHFYLETNTLYQNLSGTGFMDSASASGLGPPSRQRLAWGTMLFDADNDGWLDLFIANGHVDDFSWAESEEAYRMPPQLFRNTKDGRFEDVSNWAGEYFREKWLGRGAAMGDFDNDGDVDLVVSHQLDASAILRNDTESDSRSVVLKLIGRGRSNRSAVGARVEADGLGFKLVREVIGGGSYQSASDTRIHIGMRKLPVIPRIRIVWPSGDTEEFPNVAPGRYTVVERRGLFELPQSRRR